MSVMQLLLDLSDATGRSGAQWATEPIEATLL